MLVQKIDVEFKGFFLLMYKLWIAVAYSPHYVVVFIFLTGVHSFHHNFGVGWLHYFFKKHFLT